MTPILWHLGGLQVVSGTNSTDMVDLVGTGFMNFGIKRVLVSICCMQVNSPCREQKRWLHDDHFENFCSFRLAEIYLCHHHVSNEPLTCTLTLHPYQMTGDESRGWVCRLGSSLRPTVCCLESYAGPRPAQRVTDRCNQSPKTRKQTQEIC